MQRTNLARKYGISPRYYCRRYSIFFILIDYSHLNNIYKNYEISINQKHKIARIFVAHAYIQP